MLIKDYFVIKNSWGLFHYNFLNIFIDIPIIIISFFSGSMIGEDIIKRKFTCTWKQRFPLIKIGDRVVIPYKDKITFVLPLDEVKLGFLYKEIQELFKDVTDNLNNKND